MKEFSGIQDTFGYGISDIKLPVDLDYDNGGYTSLPLNQILVLMKKLNFSDFSGSYSEFVNNEGEGFVFMIPGQSLETFCDIDESHDTIKLNDEYKLRIFQKAFRRDSCRSVRNLFATLIGSNGK